MSGFYVRNYRGFTLLELAIVIGVVGTIVGAIWLAASAVHQKNATTRAASEIGYITNRLQSLVAINPSALYVAKDSGCSGGVSIVTGSSLNSNVTGGLFPQEMISGTDAAPVISSPWGQGDVGLVINAVSNSCAVNGGASTGPGAPGYVPASVSYSNNFSLTYLSMPVSACEQLLLSKGIGFAKAGLTQVCVGARGSNACTRSVGFDAVTAPSVLTEAAVNTACTLGGSLSASSSVSVQYTISTASP